MLLRFDEEHSDDEQRYTVVGHSIRSRVLFVVHIWRGERIRIISARKATSEERSQYDFQLGRRVRDPDEIDLTKGKWIRNPLVQRFQELNLVSLDADVKAAFPDSEAVNKALRKLMEEKKRSASELEANRSKEAA